jgi:phage tail sheath protein FI
MRPGILIQHHSSPSRERELVRCDIAGVLSFLPRPHWPPEATAGDFLQITLRRWEEFADHPQRGLVDPAARRATGSGLAEGVLAPLFERLRGEEEISLLCAPMLSWLRCEVSRVGRVTWLGDSLADELLAHCRMMNNRFLVLDAPRGLHGELLFRWFDEFRRREPETRAWGAVYYPWVMAGDELFAPSGALLGVYARMERERQPTGIAWPPANVSLRGVTHTEVEMDWSEIGNVAESGVNPLLVAPGRGVVVWGARTMSLDPAWTFINSRRIVSMVSEQLRRDNEWVIFEPNDTGLWKVVERDVMARLEQLWNAGLLSGARAMEEYSVECNRATNPLEVRDRGELRIEVKLKPVGTTEQILIDLRLGSPGT